MLLWRQSEPRAQVRRAALHIKYSALFGINCAARAAAPPPAPVDGATTRETGFDHFKRFKDAGLTCWVFLDKL